MAKSSIRIPTHEQHIVRRSAKSRRKSRTDWLRVDAMSDAEIDRAIASDPDAAPRLDARWFRDAEIVIPEKQMISIRLDADVLDHSRRRARAGRRG